MHKLNNFNDVKVLLTGQLLNGRVPILRILDSKQCLSFQIMWCEYSLLFQHQSVLMCVLSSCILQKNRAFISFRVKFGHCWRSCEDAFIVRFWCNVALYQERKKCNIWPAALQRDLTCCLKNYSFKDIVLSGFDNTFNIATKSIKSCVICIFIHFTLFCIVPYLTFFTNRKKWDEGMY